MKIDIDEVLRQEGPFMIVTSAKYEAMEDREQELVDQINIAYSNITSLTKQVRELEDRLND